MSEDLTVATEQAQPQPQINQEEQTKANLAYAAFGGEKPTTDAAQPEVVATEQSAPAQEQIVNTPATPQFIADLGYASEDDFKAAYQELKTKAETPATKEEIKFANDESKRIYEAIAAGKTKEVKSYLEAQELLSNVDSMDNEAKLKLYIKMQNPKFNQDLVNDEYTELYTLSEDRIAELELEPMKLQKEKLKLEQKLENELQKASEYFSKYKEKIELPNIQPPVQEVDENYEAYKASSAKANEDYTNVIVPAIKALTPEQVQFTVSVNDPNNNMVFDLPVVAAADDFEKAKQDSLSLSDFLAKTCYDKDGKFIPKELAEMIYLKQNFGKLSQTIARQAVNAERKRVLSKESGLGSGAAKDYNVDAPVTQLQKLEKLAFG